MSDQPWTWLDGQFLILYHWSWFAIGEGVAVSGWSQHGKLDERNYVHLAAKIGQPARCLKVDPALDSIVTPHTFTGLTQLPRELIEDDGTPILWIRALLDAERWPHDIADDEILARLLALNLERAVGQGTAAPCSATPGPPAGAGDPPSSSEPAD